MANDAKQARETGQPGAEILVVSTSLNTVSRSRLLARAAEESLRGKGVPVHWIDLRETPLPICDGGAAYDDPAVTELEAAIQRAAAILVAAPVYNYDLSAAAKNLVELTGSAWEDKVVGFLCSAGGRSSYMSVMGFANSLMLDFRSVIVPRFVYAVNADFRDGRVASTDVLERIDALVDRTVQMARELAG
jgi:FMN reductase